MAIRSSGGPLLFSDIENEFGQSTNRLLSDYYRGGSYVPDGPAENMNIPTSGFIKFSDFYGSIRSFDTCLELFSPQTATRVRIAPWDNTITHQVIFDFGSNENASAYFSRAGAIIWNGALTLTPESDPYIAPGWRDFLETITNVVINDWESLSTTPQLIFTATAVAYYESAGAVTIVASRTQGQLIVTVELSEGTVNNTGSVVGEILSQFTLQRASADCCAPALQYPTSISSGTM